MPRKARHSGKGRKGCSRMLKVKMIKGGDASEHAIAVYGGIGHQHAVSADTNLIAMNAVGTPSPLANVPAQHGGNAPLMAATTLPTTPLSLKGGNPVAIVGGGESLKLGDAKLKGGESILADLAVPAVLLVANQAMSRRHRKSGKKSRKHRKGGSKRRRR